MDYSLMKQLHNREKGFHFASIIDNYIWIYSKLQDNRNICIVRTLITKKKQLFQYRSLK